MFSYLTLLSGICDVTPDKLYIGIAKHQPPQAKNALYGVRAQLTSTLPAHRTLSTPTSKLPLILFEAI